MKSRYILVAALIGLFLSGCEAVEDLQPQAPQQTAIGRLMQRLGVTELEFDKRTGFHKIDSDEVISVPEDEKITILTSIPKTNQQLEDESLDASSPEALTNCFWTGWWQIRFVWGPCYHAGSTSECSDVAAYIEQEADTNVMYGYNGTSTASWCGRVAIHESFYTKSCPYKFDTGDCYGNGNFRELQPRILDGAGNHYGRQYLNVGQWMWTGSPGSIANAAYNGPSYAPDDHGQSLSQFPASVWLSSSYSWAGGGLFPVKITGSAPQSCGLRGHSCSSDWNCCNLCSHGSCI